MNEREKIDWLYDVERIKQLKHRYCAYCDDDYDAKGIASLFTEDGVWDGGAFGRAETRAGIEAFFEQTSARVAFANHYVTNPIIEISGTSATGRWDLWQPMVMREGEQALWLVAKYRERYAKRGSDWLFERLELDVRALTPYEEGFAKQRLVEL